MLACPECGRPLEPIKLSDGKRSWMHTPHCWHPDQQETYGEEMPLEKAIQLAQWAVESLEDNLDEAKHVLQQLEARCPKMMSEVVVRNGRRELVYYEQRQLFSD